MPGMDGSFAVGHFGGLHRHIAINGERYDRIGRFPADNITLLRQAGWLGLTVPAVFGGQAAGLQSVLSLVQSVAAGCPSTALILGMQLVHQKNHRQQRSMAGDTAPDRG
jgi:alkylation response protein AidB-like acyl-CoA dehydrogenase